MYTDDKNAQIVLALLKKYNIKKIVISPGMTNVPVAGSVQEDPFFEPYSVVDERSAAYFATGLAFESGEPVVISCTGATASRNYLSALTEAYYRNLPIIALTSQRFTGDYNNFLPQLTNRTVSQLDVKRLSVHLPVVKDEDDEKHCILSVNKALTMTTKKGCGPVHINLAVNSFAFDTANLPDIPKIEYFTIEDLLDNDRVSSLKKELLGKKVGLLIGSHRKFTNQEAEAIASFTGTYDVTVFCDHTSSYHGKNKILMSVASDLKRINWSRMNPDITIDIGGVTGDYSAPHLFTDSIFWRVSEDGEFHQRYGNLRKQFDCSEYMFFKTLTDEQIKTGSEYYSSIVKNIGKIAVPDLPFSNTFISSQVASKIPDGSSFHMSILNSLRNMNFFELNETIDSSCNVGGFGIDGALSTLVGQSMINKNRLYFGQIGDLAFFYDMNALGIRHIGNNLRILLINNGRGVEFRVSPCLEDRLGDKLDEYIAAAGHFASAQAWVESIGFIYKAARTKEEFLHHSDDFFHPDVNRFDKPMFLEAFTAVRDEQEGLRLIREANRPMTAGMDNL
jgi:2-succinyl-5-enolpyruvyl-6-hydroxy-3-cyclohexene-1-carboxylate synthase